MKKLVAVLALVLSANVSNAQAFEKGGNYVHVGFGVDPYGRNTKFVYVGNDYRIGPIVAGYEVGITEKLGIGRIGVGGVIGQSFYGTKIGNGDRITWSRTSILGRCAYHFDFGIDKMDVYAGVGVGVYIDSDEKSNNSGLILSNGGVGATHYEFAGIRYYFTDNFGVYAEAGFGLAALNGGLVFKF
jgi:hypothetical protein